MKAVILAAGEGARLSPLTNTRPKPMLPAANKPLLEHVVQAVKDAGITDIVLVVGYKRDRIQSYFGDGDDWGVDIEYAVQEKQLGTGAAVAEAEEYISEDFLVLNGDRIINTSIIDDVATIRENNGEITMAVTQVDEPWLYGVVYQDEDGYVTDIQEKPPKAGIDSDTINAGIYGFDPEIFDAIEETETIGEVGLTNVLNQNLSDHPVLTVSYDGPWMDVTRPWDLVRVNGELLDQDPVQDGSAVRIGESAFVADSTVLGADTRIYPNTTIHRGTAIGDNVTVESNVSISNSIIMDDAHIQAGSVIQDAIVGANASLGPNVTLPGGSANVVLEATEFTDVIFGGIVGDNATLGACTTVQAGTCVGNNADVGADALLHGRIEPGATVRRG